MDPEKVQYLIEVMPLKDGAEGKYDYIAWVRSAFSR